MLFPLVRFCVLFEEKLFSGSRRIQVVHFSNEIRSSKLKSPIINTVPKSESHISRTGKKKRSWLTDDRVYMHLRNSILDKPKFAGQVLQSYCMSGRTDLDDRILKCKEELQDTESIRNLHGLLFDVMAVIDHLDKAHVMPLLERECCLRMSNWTVKEVLLAMDIFYLCQWQAAMFYRSSFKWFDLKVNYLTIEPHDILQLLFYVSLYRNAPITLMRQIEQMLLHEIESYSPVELGLVCHAFFVTNTCILNYSLLEKLSQKLIKGLATKRMPAALIGNYLKVFRHAYYEDTNFYQQIGDYFLQRLPNFGMYANMQLLKTFSSLHYYHRNYCLAFVDFWEKRDLFQSPIRFKTLVDIVSSCVVFQIKPPTNVTDKLMDVIKDEYRELSSLYQEKLIEGLVALVMTDRYPLEAISYVLSPRIKKEDVILEQMYQCQLLDESVQVFCPHYQGYRLPERWIMQFHNYKVNLIKQMEWRKGVRVILDMLQVLLGNCVRIDTVMLCSQVPVLVINVDENNTAIPLSDGEPVFFSDTFLSESIVSKLTQLQREEQKAELNADFSVLEQITRRHDSISKPFFQHKPNYIKNKPHGRKLVVMVLGRNQFHKNVDVLHGLYAHIIKLMLALGYEVMGISPWHAAQVECMTSNEVKQFTKSVILDNFGIKY